MVAKAALLFCAQALLVQYISAQFIGAPCNGIADGLVLGPANYGGACNGISYNEAPLAYTASFAPASSYGGGFPVRSASPVAPTGVAMTSENVYEGALAVSGAVPFLGAVGLEGDVPTAGAGAVTYSCGNGDVAILNEGVNDFNALAGPYGYNAGAAVERAYGYAPMAYDAGIVGPGYGYGYGYNRGCNFGPVY